MRQHTNDILRKNLSACLTKARGGRSQAEFARFLGIPSQQTYQRYEDGKVMPGGDVLHTIASKLGVTTDGLLRGELQPAGSGDHVAVDLTVWKDSWLYDIQDYLTKESRQPGVGNQERSGFLKSLRAIVAELERRERQAALNSASLSSDVELALKGAAAAQKLARVPAPKRKADAPSESKPERGGDAGRDSK